MSALFVAEWVKLEYSIIRDDLEMRACIVLPVFTGGYGFVG